MVVNDPLVMARLVGDERIEPDQRRKVTSRIPMATHSSGRPLIQLSHERKSKGPKHLGNRVRFLAHKSYPAGNIPGKTL